METTLASVRQQNFQNLEWIEVVLFLSDLKYLDVKKISVWKEQFGNITIASPAKRPEKIQSDITWHTVENDGKRALIWNLMLSQTQKNWVLFLEDDESIHLSSIPDRQRLNNETWCPTLIRQARKWGFHQYYQMRLIHTSDEIIFDGINLPDCTRYIRKKDIKLLNHSIIIERDTDPTDHIDINEELSIKKYSPKLYLISGERYLNEKKYVRAAAQFRRLLKEEKLLPFDRLGGVNGLASCLVEQYKWNKAMTLSNESLSAESLQSVPYLIQFKIYELRKEWEKAYDMIKRYYEQFSLYSRASFDKIIDEEETLVDLANVALKAGKRREATSYFEKLFTFKREEVDRALLKKVLVLSIELNDFERSVYLFERIYKDDFLDTLSDEREEELDDIMTMFMKREWYTYVSQIYTKLHNLHPENRKYKRKLIVALTKTNRLDKAKAMLTGIV